MTIATRESALALWQAHHIRERLAALHPGIRIDVLGLTTEGDRRLGSSLAKIGGKGLFVKELENALAEGRAALAVHSMKDVPMQLPAGFTVAAITAREDPRDAFVSNRYGRLAEMPVGARVGTSSLRRESQLRARHSRLDVQPLRGNVNTRLRKLDEGDFDAIILAAAGLKRLGLADRVSSMLDPQDYLPAAGQGALGIECCSERADIVDLLRPLDHAPTAWCVRAERAVSRALGGSCIVPLGAFAEVVDGGARLRAFVGTPNGGRVARAEVTAQSLAEDPEAVGQRAADRLVAAGAREILAALPEQ